MQLASALSPGSMQEGSGNIVHLIALIIGYAALAIETLAVIVIIIFIVGATYSFVVRLTGRRDGAPAFDEYKVRLGRGLLLGLEILVVPHAEASDASAALTRGGSDA